MEALVLAATLLTADAEVRQSEAFACWCQVCYFPDVTALQESGNAHLEWLNARQEFDSDINPAIDELIAEQTRVLRVYSLVGIVRARPYAPDDWGRLEEIHALIGDDYFAGRLPAPVTCQRH